MGAKMLCGILAFCSTMCCGAQANCLFKNPLCFYNADVLTYMQVLHKNQQYTKMAAFFYGPLQNKTTRSDLAKTLSDVDFGFALKRVGVKETGKNTWSLTYQRTLLGTQENFKIDCMLLGDTCRVYLDQKLWKVLFER
jgi:hypothetical protein